MLESYLQLAHCLTVIFAGKPVSRHISIHFLNITLVLNCARYQDLPFLCNEMQLFFSLSMSNIVSCFKIN